MDIYNDFRSSENIGILADEVRRIYEKPVNIMEICGGHTHVIMRFGINQIVPDGVVFLHGPGCPVCVMPKERIDQAIIIAGEKDVILVTLGDMMRVPGSVSSLMKERAGGHDIRMVYSPLDSIRIARENPSKKVVYCAIGFETTAPITAAVIHQTLTGAVKNLLFHINHVLVPPAIHAIMSSEDVKIEAFIAPGHVSTITGIDIYQDIAKSYSVPLVVSGFEPVDILQSVSMILRQVSEGRGDVEIQYKRAVNPEGNIKAQDLVSRYFATRETFRWRGLGDIPRSGLRLKDDYSAVDAEVVYGELLPDIRIDDHKFCLCGEILRGKARPTDCRVFGNACTPKNPIGACMVSSEGACHAYYTYRQV
ncbi:hydrogenase expression/formation protein HypD [bacterium BMS3Bbin06]|nr:hydrogenase expression/formation protein HypD [bacterium BMS3Abin08]GBE35037.1 hydrogenase expression/formation protein HypD [bacterium BMS3Bbin06]HDO36029.1 hydrogenase formation protein HypD [Nitrospirota bacterium]HDY71885.1 hydrogenase formation protein HypD [Nitrospirota bacterium]